MAMMAGVSAKKGSPTEGTKGGEEEEERRKTQQPPPRKVLLHGRRIPRGGRRSTNQIDRSETQKEKKTWRFFFRFPKQFERITWCSFAGENVARQQKNVSEMFGVPWKVKASRELVSSEMFKKLNVSFVFFFFDNFYGRVCERKEQKRHEKCRIWI